MRPLTSALAALFLFVLPFAAFGQTAAVARSVDGTPAGMYPIPGSHLLQKENQEVLAYVAQHPEALVRSKLQKTAWSFAVGSTYTWKAQTFGTVSWYDVPSTCRAIGTHCYIFVEDAGWGTKVTQAAVDSIMGAFDTHTPANPSKGVYQTDVETFGNPPDVDGDPRIIILVLDINDGYTGSGGFVAGYFWRGNEVPGYTNGNNAEIYYVDDNPLDLTQSWGITTGMSTAAHEFQHMIHWGKDPNEITFMNEGCSCFAESNCGYGIHSQSGYVNETNHYLLDWRAVTDPNVLNDYGRAARFFQYIGDQFGADVLMPIVASTLHGIAGLDAGLATFGTSRRFADIFPDWLIANILDDRAVNPNYGYVYPNLPKAVGTIYVNPNVASTGVTVASLGGQYLSYTGGTDLRITFTTSSSALLFKAVEIGSPSRVLDVTPGVEFHEPGFGAVYSKINFVAINTSQSSSASFSYQSSGSGATSFELKYDTSEPTGGYLALQAGDTACVWFTGVQGARLDSVRVALNVTGSLNGGVYRYTGVQQPTPLGTRLAVPVTATRSGSSAWATIDLRSYGIDAGSNFAVAFPYTGSNPRVQVVDVPYTSGDVFHSYTYYTEATNDNWYVLTDSQTPGNAFGYSIRAYVSIGSTDVPEPLAQFPSATRLAQNYPNPFNPVTRINYTIGGNRGEGLGISDVTLIVYDMLGRQVEVLVNERKTPGDYDVTFDGTGLSSGVYIYRLTVGASVQARTMVLVK
jgi:hypothetical protein